MFSNELVSVLGDRVAEAVAFLVNLGQNEDTAIGHLEGLIKGKGSFDAAHDGGLADAFPELFRAHQDALGVHSDTGVGSFPTQEHIQDGPGLGLASGEAPSTESAT